MLEFVTAAEIFGGPSLENDQAAGRAVVRYAALDTPEDVARAAGSHTGRFLRAALGEASGELRSAPRTTAATAASLAGAS